MVPRTKAACWKCGHKVILIDNKVRWCPTCNLVECIRSGNLIPHPAMFLTELKPKPHGELGSVIPFTKGRA